MFALSEYRLGVVGPLYRTPSHPTLGKWQSLCITCVRVRRGRLFPYSCLVLFVLVMTHTGIIIFRDALATASICQRGRTTMAAGA